MKTRIKVETMFDGKTYYSCQKKEDIPKFILLISILIIPFLVVNFKEIFFNWENISNNKWDTLAGAQKELKDFINDRLDIKQRLEKAENRTRIKKVQYIKYP